jgi:hypothetical protein
MIHAYGFKRARDCASALRVCDKFVYLKTQGKHLCLKIVRPDGYSISLFQGTDVELGWCI